MDIGENTMANGLHLNSLLTELADTQEPIKRQRNERLTNNLHGHSEPRKSHTDQTEEEFDDELEVQFDQTQASPSPTPGEPLREDANDAKSTEQRVARLQRYRQGVWELNFDLKAFERWRKVGLSLGLNSDTEIASFLLQHYENTKEESLPSQPFPSFCTNCNTALTMCCTKCHFPPSAADLTVPHLQSEKESVESCSSGILSSSEEMLASLQAYLGQSTVSRIRKAIMSAKNQPVSCSICSMAFTRASSLNVHMRKHTGEKPYMCQECGAAFTHASSLSVHKRTHTGEKPFICEECGAAFAVASVLKQHKRKHTGEKPYKCKLCDAAFTQSTKLTIHMRKHTGDRPYQCEQCGASFTHSNRLKIHLRTHNGIKPYKCLDCGKAFSQSAHLTVHMRIHTGDKPFKCAECGAAFLDSTHLRRHERTHTGEKPHKCIECGAAYSTAFGLRRHEWSHTDHEKPYKCGRCQKTFTTAFCLKRHEEKKGRCKYRPSFTSHNRIDT